jgi:hypothetical protein
MAIQARAFGKMTAQSRRKATKDWQKRVRVELEARSRRLSREPKS